MEIGNKIKILRKKAGYTQEQLACKLGVSGQSISKWEKQISMPDITLLPDIAEVFGVSIDELFDLTIEQKFKRIENRIEIEEELSEQAFSEYEEFLKAQLASSEHRATVLSLLANLYYHRMESDGMKVSKYGREAILLDPAKKDCQWLLIKAEGHTVWDWNIANHSDAIDFYKEVIAADKGNPKSALPYYYLIDNLLADNRADEAESYLKIFATLPSANPAIIDVYKAYIALARFDVATADEIIEAGLSANPDNCSYLFEAAQYYARRCMYDQAISLYERDWELDKKPRYTDALQSIAMIYKIKGDNAAAIKTYDRLLECLKSEWGNSEEDKPYLEILREKNKLLG